MVENWEYVKGFLRKNGLYTKQIKALSSGRLEFAIGTEEAKIDDTQSLVTGNLVTVLWYEDDQVWIAEHHYTEIQRSDNLQIILDALLIYYSKS